MGGPRTLAAVTVSSRTPPPLSRRADTGACSADPSGTLWSCSSSQGAVTCSVDDDDSGISCRDERHCPYAEEIRPIRIAVQLRSKHFLVENYPSSFFLSDISEAFEATG